MCQINSVDVHLGMLEEAILTAVGEAGAAQAATNMLCMASANH
jgi:hypothetical protein